MDDTTRKGARARGGGAAAELRALREELARLAGRVATLEAELGARAAPPAPADRLPAEPAPAPPPAAEPPAAAAMQAAAATPPPAPAAPVSAAPAAEGIPEDVLLVISAAIAAFLGKKARIRQIRLAESFTWMYAGRVNIQASHVLPVHPRGGASS